jgi:hypothetical protein
MPGVEFEPTIPASERAKTVHVLDRPVTVASNLFPSKVSKVFPVLN